MTFYSIDSITAVAKYLRERQYMEPALWRSFVRQFEDKVDNLRAGGYHGEYWGKTMRGAVLIYKFTKDESLYVLLEKSVRELLAVQEDSGRISSYKTEIEFTDWDMWCRKYVSVGMEYFYSVCKSEDLRGKIVKALMGHCDYIISKVGAGPGKVPITSTSYFWCGLNSCSILKSFVVLYEMTGEKRYLDFAEYIVSTGFASNGNVYRDVKEGKKTIAELCQKKAYEMTSCFEGIIELYKVTQNPEYLQTAVNFAGLIERYETTIIGGVGTNHECFNNSAKTQFMNYFDGNQETCVTVSVMLYYNELYKVTGDVKYLRAIDYAYRNAYLGALNNMCSEVSCGLPFASYSPLRRHKRAYRLIGGCLKIEKNRRYGCCVAIGGAGAGVYAEGAIECHGEEIKINYYTAQVVTLKVGDEQVVLDITTPMDRYGRAEVKLNLPHKMHLKFGFLKMQPDVIIKEFSAGDAKVDYAGDYIFAEGEFENGNVINVEFDIPYTVVEMPKDDVLRYGWYAVRRGNTVFALDTKYEKFGGAILFNPQSLKFKTLPAKPEVMHMAEMDMLGRKAILIDYASAGKSWKNDSKVSVWLKFSARNCISSRLECLLMNK